MRFAVSLLFAALAVSACGNPEPDTSTEAPSGISRTNSNPGQDTSTDAGTVATGGTPTGQTPTGGGTDPTSPPAMPDPMLARTVYQSPASVDSHTIPSSNTGGSPSVTGFAYSVFPAMDGWSPIETVRYPVADLGASNQFAGGTFTDTAGVSHLGYRFTIARRQTPDWGGSPRVELDSATARVQNPSDGMPSNNGWADGVITAGKEMWFTWSMYLDLSFSLTQKWCTLFQLHPGNTNYDSGSPRNAYPNARWPALIANGGLIAFGNGPDAMAPGQVWTAQLSDYRGRWVDLAFHAKFSTGSDGLMEFYVDGQKVGATTGNNLVYATTGGTPPWFYLKQGYYRDPSVQTMDTVYQTPILATVKE